MARIIRRLRALGGELRARRQQYGDLYGQAK
ncbi:hypothetical protein ABIA38_003723 [Embleya sp. AB8]